MAAVIKIEGDKQYKKMTETPVAKLLLMLSLPAVAAMAASSLYNMTDTFFVRKLGAAASGGIGMTFPITAFIQAVGFTVGTGAGSRISLLLGEKKNREADTAALSGLVWSAAFGIIITILGAVFRYPLMTLFGAKEELLKNAADYSLYIFISAPVMTVSFLLNNLLRAEGRTGLSMIGMLVGGAVNIALDPLLIFSCGLGVKGAAISTLIGQTAGLVLLAMPFLLRKTVLKLELQSCLAALTEGVIKDIVRSGLPSLFRQGLAAVAAAVLNKIISPYGDNAVSGISISSKLFLLLFSVILGIGQAYQPIAGYNYSSDKHIRVKKATTAAVIFSQVCASVLALAGCLCARSAVGIFISGNDEVVEIGAKAFRYACVGLVFTPVPVIVNMLYQAVGRPCLSAFTASLRQGILFIPLILILPSLWGFTGAVAAQPAADVLNFFIALPFLISFIRKLNKGKSD